MAKHKLKQIPLVSAKGKARPPLPGGWALAVFEAINTFAPDLASKHRPKISGRSADRLKAGESVKQTTYDEVEDKLVEAVTELFPKVSSINGFARKYVKEYLSLWTSGADIAPQWIRALGHQPELTGVLARALVRDFALRLCYLESCERVLNGERFGDEELRWFRHGSPGKVYEHLITSQKVSLEKLAENFKTHEKKFRRLKKGVENPEWNMLRTLGGTDDRMLAGIGFMDVLIRTVGIEDGKFKAEIMCMMEMFLATHHEALKESGEVERFKKDAVKADYLLLHRGLETMWSEMPDALWGAHLTSLQFARPVDLAQAYCQYSTPKSDRRLRKFLEGAERRSDDSPHQWMRELQRHKSSFKG
jgi:hypothetical protein